MESIDLNLGKNVLDHWSVSDALREIISNAFDDHTKHNIKKIPIIKVLPSIERILYNVPFANQIKEVDFESLLGHYDWTLSEVKSIKTNWNFCRRCNCHCFGKAAH